MNTRNLLAFALVMQLISPCQVWSQVAAPRPAHSSTSTPAPAQDLDLASAQRTLTAFQAGHFESATIHLGDTTRAVTPVSSVTPAELVALRQVLSGIAQSLQLTEFGNAVGGTFNLDRQALQTINNLVIPEGVRAVHDFASSTVNLAGNLTNSGTIYAISTSSAVSTATISATNILNAQGATITTVLPSADLAGAHGLVTNLNLNLVAINDIINAGTIASAGTLTMTAGGSIVNSLPAGVVGPAPSLSAMQDISLNSSNLINNGIVSAHLGNINIASLIAQNIAINNAAGRLEALAGTINVRDALFASKNDIWILGGKLLSKELNLYSGTGKIQIDVDEINGLTNVYGHEAHITTSTGKLSLGTLSLTGDPVFANTGGSLEITSGLGAFQGQDLAFLAAGDVFSTSTLTVNTSGTGGSENGGDILIVAGALFAGTGGTTGSDTSSSPNTTNGQTYIISPGAGGDISLPNVSLNSSAHTGGSGTNAGGNVTLIAYPDLAGNKGAISVGSISTGGGNGGASGTVIIVGGTTSSTISAGNINTVGEGGSGGAVTVINATPVPAPVTLTINPGGNTFTLSGSFAAGPLPVLPISSTVNLGPINAIGAVDLRSSNTLTVQGVSTANSSGQAQSIKLTGGTAGSGGVIVNGNLRADGGSSGAGHGGLVEISSEGFVQITGDISANGGGTSGNGGEIVISYNDQAAAGPLVIGSASGLQFVSGGLTANAAGTGAAGSVTIANTNSSGNLAVDLQGLISATNSSLGSLSFGGTAGQSVSVTGPGELRGQVIATGDSVNISVGTGDLNAGSVTATNGSVGLAASSGDITVNDQITANGSIQIASGPSGRVTVADTTTVEGTVITINTPLLNNNGTITATATGVFLQSNAPSLALAVTLGQDSELNASGPGGTISFNGTENGAVTVSGGPANGHLYAAGSIQVNTGTGALGAVDIHVNSVGGSGIVVARGSSVSFRTSDGDLTLSSIVTDAGGDISFRSDTGSVSVVPDLTTDGGTIDVRAGGTLNLRSVSTSSTAGSAGNITLRSGTASDGDLIVTGLIDASGAFDGSGGTIAIQAGDGVQNNSGHVQVSGSITANGAGVGDGGVIEIKYHDPIAPATFRVGPDGLEPPVENFVSGSIHVDATGDGHGGEVFITNTAAQQLAIDLVSTISANSTNPANVGLLNFFIANQPVSISGAGTFIGGVVVSGSQLSSTICCLTFLIENINIGSQGVNIFNPNGHVVILGQLRTTGGAINIETLSVTNTASGLIRTSGSPGATGININSAIFVNDGLVDADGALTMSTSGDLSISGGGSIRAGAGLTLNSQLGHVNVSQSAITGGISGESGLSFNVVTTDTGPGTGLSAANITAQGGSISLVSNNSMRVVDSSQMVALNNISLLAPGTITIGQLTGAGVSMSAGSLSASAPADNLQVLPGNSVESAGSITIDTYLDGLGSGDVIVGANVSMTSHGGTLTLPPIGLPIVNRGFVSIRSGNDVTLAQNVSIVANGDNLVISAVDDIAIAGGASLISRAKYDDLSRLRAIPGAANFVITSYTGGGIAIFAGDPVTDLHALLDQKIDQRTGFNSPSIQPGVPLLAVNDVTIDRGGLFEVTMPPDTTDKFTVSGSVFESIGGVILLDPPAEHTLTISNAATIQVVGPLVLPPAPPGQPREAPAPFVSLNAPRIETTNVNNAALVPTDVTRTNQSALVSPDQQRRKAEEITEEKERESQSSGNVNIVIRTWFMSNGYCQPFAFEGENGTTVLTAQGTFISASGTGRLTLKEGLILAVAGEEPVTVETSHGTILVAANSSTMVNHNESGALRVSNLAGAPAQMALAGAEKSALMSMAPGEEILVSDPGLSEEELIPMDGVEREVISGAMKIGSVRVQKNKFSRADMAERGTLVSCQMGPFSIVMRRRMGDLRDDLSGKSSPEAALPKNNDRLSEFGPDPNIAGLIPVSYVRPAKAPATATCQTLSTRDATFKYLPGTVLIMDDSDAVELPQGEVLIEARKSTVVKHGIFQVQVQPGTISLVTGAKDVLKVRNLWESQPDSLRAYVGSRLISSSAGQELILTRDDSSRRLALKLDQVGRRRTKSFDLSNGQTITSSEFSLVSLAADSPLLYRLLRSDRDSERVLSRKVIKMAACLTHAHSHHGSFSSSAHVLHSGN